MKTENEFREDLEALCSDYKIGENAGMTDEALSYMLLDYYDGLKMLHEYNGRIYPLRGRPFLGFLNNIRSP